MHRPSFARPKVALYGSLSICCTMLHCAAEGERGQIPLLSITVFDVHPLYSCAPENITIRFQTGGAAVTELSSTPETTPPLGVVGSTGTENRTISTTTEFKIRVIRPPVEHNNTKTVHIVASGGEPFSISAFGTCEGGSPMWTHVLAPDEWDSRIRVIRVLNTTPGRSVSLSHGGVSLVLSPDGADDSRFRGQQISGEWTLAPDSFLPSERCSVNSGMDASLPRLSLSILAECQG